MTILSNTFPRSEASPASLLLQSPQRMTILSNPYHNLVVAGMTTSLQSPQRMTILSNMIALILIIGGFQLAVSSADDYPQQHRAPPER